ncbi:protein ROOT INITIATION DEFECTIVE 3-like isoform X1 [Gossypium raimondii]|uniref:protein ROOT INITIATION DEFECTIVE 3-like isoform X1 n=1 Tax=Gossypium raimondii TaxID=29730 RepID=UPI00227C632D|nr:protein ROOT INITIATION DEFECTIVE 3-like isoform X1 [Gossypium raimondii]
MVSASEDHTCKVWSLSRGRLLRNIMFPSIIDAIALDPGEHVLYAGFQDGKIYIAALNAESSPSNSPVTNLPSWSGSRTKWASSSRSRELPPPLQKYA